MTDDMIALRELLEKGSDATLLREMIGFAAQRLMELESEALCGAGHGERSEARINLRNGYRDRDWHTRGSAIEFWPRSAGQFWPTPRPSTYGHPDGSGGLVWTGKPKWICSSSFVESMNLVLGR